MHRLAIKRNTKNEAHLTPNTHVTAFVRPPVGTVPFAAPAHTCADTVECRLQCTRRGVRTANLHAVRSAVTATAELLVEIRRLRACWLKIAYFSYPSLIRRSHSPWSLWNFAVKLTVRKLESWGYYVVTVHDPNFNRLRLIHLCDRQTDGR